MINEKCQMRNGKFLGFPACLKHQLRRLGSVAHHEVKRAGRSFPEACVSVQGNGDAYGGVLTGKLEAAFKQPVVDLIDVERSTLFTQQESDGLRNRSVHEPVAKSFSIWP
jgi:hypothetical protein